MDQSLPGSSVNGILPAEVWSQLPRPPPGDLPNPGMQTESLTSHLLQWQVGSLPLVPPGKSMLFIK